MQMSIIVSKFRQFVRLASCKQGFTLAEVLITLGLIGIIAALVMPQLAQKYTNLIVETKLQKFYTTINQAIILAEIQYGNRQDWYIESNSVDKDESGKPIDGTSAVDKWWKKYIAPNMTTVKTT